MERLMEEALIVQDLLPWIESDEDIINFMRKIPLDKSHLRNQLTLRYFLKKRDNNDGDRFEQSIEDDARDIVIVLPDVSYKEIKERLTVLGNMPNRKEAVLRQLLYQKRDLDKIVTEIDVNGTKKRKSEPRDNIFDLDSTNNETNIKIKIRRREGSLEVVSKITQELLGGSSKVTSKSQLAEEPICSSTCITSSTNNSDSNKPDSTVQSAETNNDSCPEWTYVLEDLQELYKENDKPSTSRSVIPVSYNIHSPVSSVNSNTAPGKKVIVTEEGSMSKPNVTTNTEIDSEMDMPRTNEMDEAEFNLVDYVKQMTVASEIRIRHLCENLNLNLHKKPHASILNHLLNEIIDDVIEVESDADDVSSNSLTQEYTLDDDIFRNFSHVNENKTNTDTPETSKNLIGREFKLKEPILNVSVRGSTTDFSKPVMLSPTLPRAILKAPTLLIADETPTIPNNISHINENLPPRRVTTIPAMPEQLKRPRRTELNRIEEPPQNPVGDNAVDLTSPELFKNFFETDVDMLDLAVAGPSTSAGRRQKCDEKLFYKLIEMFPDACPDFVRDMCAGKRWNEIEDIIETLSGVDYPRRPLRAPSPVKEVDLEEQYDILKELLPDADPTYLRMQCEKYATDDKGLKQFIDQAVEHKQYPTMKEYLRKQQLSAQQKQYTTEFNIENFVQLFPEPEKTFNDPKRTIKLDTYSQHYITQFFRNKYDRIAARKIPQVLFTHNYEIMRSNQVLQEMAEGKDFIKTRRKHVELPDNLQNIPLLQELAYLNHKEAIEAYLQEKKEQEELERLEAKKNNLMQTCQCCFDDEVMPKDTFTCPSGCKFCKGCIKKSCEVALGDGKTDFNCLADCSTEFTLQTLQNVLPPKMFSKLAQKKALAEIKAAGIEELETCPFCDFASIPNETDKMFRCLNPDCMKESCRACKEPNHVPLKCEEVEKDLHVKARVYVENKMTEALLRKCYKCGTSFFKDEGCNKMTCSCGAQMCYVCKQPVKDYSHFNGIGGDKFHLCPLYSDTNLLNQQNVLGAAEAAKAEIDPTNLRVDPTADVADHYKDRAKRLPREPHLELLHRNPHHIHQRRRHHHHHNRHNLRGMIPGLLNAYQPQQ